MDILWSVLLLSMLTAVVHSDRSVIPSGVGICNKLRTTSDLGNTTALSNVGILARAVSPTNDGANPPMVQVVDFQLVCEVAGARRDTVGGVSVVVEYMCMGPLCREDIGASDVITLTEQFNFECSSNDASQVFTARESVLVAAGTEARDENTLANLNTPLADQCSQCVDPSTAAAANEVTHCRACRTTCNSGMRRCLGTSVDGCCNYYLNDVCVTDCGSLLGDPVTFDCGCGDLTETVGTTIMYSDRTNIGSVATFSCDEASGYRLPSQPPETPMDRTCAETDGWSNTNIVCQLHNCGVADLDRPDSGSIVYTTTTFNSMARFDCQNDFVLSGDRERVCKFDGWSGENPTCVPVSVSTTASVGSPGAGTASACAIGCIIGIILAILGAIIIAAIVAGVAYGIYSYLNHPDTKLAKLDGDNINGVARDNPLYVDPEAVVGDGAEAA